MINMFLSSSFSDVAEKFTNYLKDFPNERRVTFIPTASLVEEVDFFVDEAKQVFENLNFSVDVLDISTENSSTIANTLEKNDFIYISGGNTFYLLEQLKASGAFEVLLSKINAGKIYIGESAGAVITSENIDYASQMDDKSKAPTLNSYTGLNLIPYSPLPHYKEEPFSQITIDIFNKYDKINDMIPLTNSEALIVKDTSLTVI
ncbi:MULTISPECIES: Type 1 glutamine amidotransferase-like domain-containing protein [Enterococcus]|uniref:Type 1 glutamine amidotransferase-like domain-containing protein n=1 Tax=Enterococcus TaxID=1350 RepID=UPI000ED511C9|nr:MULTISPECIES: Type 1 glutamine amidotransferase-like domain-containing protein [Enterococcus]HCM86040.1 peptidase [Enterococcus sp.]